MLKIKLFESNNKLMHEMNKNKVNKKIQFKLLDIFLNQK